MRMAQSWSATGGTAPRPAPRPAPQLLPAWLARVREPITSYEAWPWVCAGQAGLSQLQAWLFALRLHTGFDTVPKKLVKICCWLSQVSVQSSQNAK